MAKVTSEGRDCSEGVEDGKDIDVKEEKEGQVLCFEKNQLANNAILHTPKSKDNP